MRNKFRVPKIITWLKAKFEKLPKTPLWLALVAIIIFINANFDFLNNINKYLLRPKVEIRSFLPYLHSSFLNPKDFFWVEPLHESIKESLPPEMKVFIISVPARIRNPRSEPITFSDFRLHLFHENLSSSVSDKYILSESTGAKKIDSPILIAGKEIKDLGIDFVFHPLHHLELMEFAEGEGKFLSISSFFVTFKDENGNNYSTKKYGKDFFREKS